jgi:hypothetical protein
MAMDGGSAAGLAIRMRSEEQPALVKKEIV